MLQDSFGSALIPSLSWCFSRSVFVWTHSIDRAVVEQEKPDIIILEIVERNLDRLLGDDLYE
jgi:wyosine [tRNA(Phe)-imidazoG37] synthetase (radical SAM superfamily)